MPKQLYIVFALVCATFAGCAGSIKSLPVAFDAVCVSCDHPACDSPLVLTYLGSGGFLMRRKSDEIATGPFFSNPNIFDVALVSIESDAKLVKHYLPKGPNLKAILIGHGHYDHLMDIPTVVELRGSAATIYASESAAFSLASVIPMADFELVDKRTAPNAKLPDWMTVPDTNARVRLLAIKSDHAPHAFGITLFHGQYTEAQPLPRRASDWLDGPNYSFLIEFRDDNGNVDFRIHYQDSASDSGTGMPPKELDAKGARVPYTIMLPTVASWENVTDYPNGLVERLKPDYAVLAHWEDFFRPFTTKRESLRTVRMTDVPAFIENLKMAMGRSAYILPAPLTEIRFARHCT